jgi:alkanesulfonate monooxygenase SsuD/methylene tetrahydromethanopterin reductase-like flavin-dependent oxidoreductase (luciferase family)
MSFDAPGVRVSRLREALHVLKGLFADQTLTFSGSYYSISQLEGFPKPLQRSHLPILIGAGSRRMLELAAQEANIVGILPRALPDGTISEEVIERLPATMEQKIAWVRQAAGERMSQLELNMVIAPMFTDQQQQKERTEQLIRERGWSGISVEQALEMPSVFVGSADQMAEVMWRRRELYGFSYYVVSDAQMEVFAPVVALLAGK